MKSRHKTAVTVILANPQLRAGPGWYSVLIGESNVAIDPAIGAPAGRGYGAADIYLGEFSPPPPFLELIFAA